MAEGADRNRWLHTSQLMCTMANGLMKKKSGGSFKPSDFDPYRQMERRRRKVHKLSPTEGVKLLAKLLSQ